MGRGEAVAEGRDFVVRSLREFPSRDGRDRSRRLKMKGREPLYRHHDLVAVEMLSPTVLRLVPYRRGETQHERLSQMASTVTVDMPAREFLVMLDAVLQTGRDATSAKE